MRHILVCRPCMVYTLKDECPGCGGKTEVARPPKYSPEDKYSRFRRQVREKERQEKGLL